MVRQLSVVVLVSALWCAEAAAQKKTAAAPATTPEAQAAFVDMEKTFGFVPAFFRAMPAVAVPGLWDQFKTLQMNPNSAIPPKMKELIGLAVSSQVPCKYCVYAHTKFIKAQGGSDAEVGEAVAMAALTRQWSTFVNGIQLDEARFKTELQQMVAHAKKAMSSKTPPPPPLPLTDSASALKDMETSMGVVPEFMKRYPEVGRTGAWRMWRDVEMSNATVVPSKYKSLIGVAVAAQVPCRYCVIADTEFAKLSSATEAEITEAVAIAGFVRAMSTLLNGLQIDEAQFHKDVDRLSKPPPAPKKSAMATPASNQQ